MSMKSVQISVILTLFLVLFCYSKNKNVSDNATSFVKEVTYDEGVWNYTSYKNLVMAGYQGWFTAEGDGAERGWRHYGKKRCGGFAPGCTSVDLWPDMKEYSKQVLHTTHKSDFVTTNSGTIIDKKNNLEWCIASDKDYSWNEANQWIKNLNADTGLWHLPTSEQLITLFDKKESSGYGYMWQGKIFTAKIDTAFGKIGHSCWVWTNEMLGSEKAYSVNFSEGIKVVSLKNTKDYPIRVFAVRKLRSS